MKYASTIKDTTISLATAIASIAIPSLAIAKLFEASGNPQGPGLAAIVAGMSIVVSIIAMARIEYKRSDGASRYIAKCIKSRNMNTSNLTMRPRKLGSREKQTIVA